MANVIDKVAGHVVGPQGPQGPQGPKGDTGQTGPQGATGATGATPNLTIGTVATLEPDSQATATITGTAENPVLNLGLPKGRTGEVSQAEFDEVAGDVSQLKSEFTGLGIKETAVDLSQCESIIGVIAFNNTWSGLGNPNNTSALLAGVLGDTQITITANSNQEARFSFLKDVPTTPTYSTDPVNFCDGETGRHTISASQTEKFTVPSDCMCVCFSILTNGINYAPSSVVAAVKSGGELERIYNSIADTKTDLNSFVSAVISDDSGDIKKGAVTIQGPDTNRPYIITTNGVIDYTQPAGWSCAIIPCDGGDEFILTGAGGSGNYRLYSFVGDTTKHVVFCISVADGSESAEGVTNKRIIAPYGSKYAIFNFKKVEGVKPTIHHIHTNVISYLYDNAISSSPHIRFMVFGNSYGCDSISYVPTILKNMGITCEIYLYRRDGCSLRDIYNRWESTADRDEETDGIHTGSYGRSVFHIDTRKMTAWETVATISMKDCVALGDWDFITLQQWSAYSIDESTYEPWLSLVIDRIRQVIDKPTKIAWTGVCTRATADNPQAGLTAMQNAVYKVQPVDFLIPYGTAIFNARTNDTLAEIGDYTNHNLWCSDGIHLQDGLPRYIAALGVVEAICKEFFPTKSVLYDKTRPTTESMTTWGVLQQHLPVVGITEANCLLAQKSAILANNFPFTITQINDLPYLEYSSLSEFPVAGESGILYCDTSTGYTYTWDGSAYVQNIAN